MMKLNELIEKIDKVKVEAEDSIGIIGISYDTKKIKAGELFVAVKGYKSDGHDYIKNAAEKGALCVICERPPDIRIPYVIVKDSRKALADISAVWFGYPAKKLKLVGVTGTNGKTSVTNLIKFIIEECSDCKVGLIGTNGNFIGNREIATEHTTPESYELHKLLGEMVLEGCRYVVMEVSSHALYLSRVHGITYDIGVFTNLTPDHLDFHGTMEDYAYAKSILFRNCAKAVINIDDDCAQMMIRHAVGPVTTFAVNNCSADLVGKDIKLQSDKTDFCVLALGSINRVELMIPGIFSVYNALAAIAATVLLGFEIDDITKPLQSFHGVRGRAEVLPTGYNFSVLIDYAHTPDALENIIRAVRGYAKGKVVTLFGCGGDRDRKKRPLMGNIATMLSDLTIVTSDNPRTEEPKAIIDEILTGVKRACAAYEVIENRREAICRAIDRLMENDVLIIAGKGHETYQIFGNKKIHFDDREVVADYLKQMHLKSGEEEKI